MKSKFTKPVTAAEAMERLQKDPEFVRQNEEREGRRRAFEEKLAEEEKPLLVELARAGFRLESVWDLVNADWSYPAAIPVLARHLRLAYHPKIREGIARALTVRESCGIAGRDLLDELKFRPEDNAEVRWALANALTKAADASMAEEINALAADPRHQDVHNVLTLVQKKLGKTTRGKRRD